MQIAERQRIISIELGALYGYVDYEDNAPFADTTITTAETLARQLLQESSTTIEKTDNQPLEFTEKEISKMPKQFRSEFRINGCTTRLRKRGNSYEIRYRRNGYNVTACANTREKAKQKFIEKLNTTQPQASDVGVPTKYNEFVEYWFENYYKERVISQTYANGVRLFQRWIKPRFETVDLKRIMPGTCKELLQGIKNKGLEKTADDVHSILNQTLKMAVAYNLIPRNPLAVISFKQHERKNGTRLTLDEQTRLLTDCKPQYRYFFAVYLYAGLRPGEIYSVQLGERFITSLNLKQKNHKVEYKRIPIIPKLRPYLNEAPAKLPTLAYIRKEFNRVLPNHTLKDCRRTFSSYCKELGVNNDVREKILGHAPKNALDKAYVELSDEFILQECAKLIW